MANLINSISNSLINALTQAELSDKAVGIYQIAKANNNTATMDRASHYAIESRSRALDYSSKIDDDLKKAIEKLSAEQKEKEESVKETDATESEKDNSNKSSDNVNKNNHENQIKETAVIYNSDCKPDTLSASNSSGTVTNVNIYV